MTAAAAWLAERTSAAPAPLAERLHAAVSDTAVASTRLPAVFVDAADRLLRRLLEDGCRERQAAIDLLVADALVTYAFEAAADSSDQLEDTTTHAMRRLSALGVSE